MKIFIILAAILAVSLAYIPCTPGWTEYNGRCYILIPDQRDYVTAAEVCLANGAYLVSIEDASKNIFVEWMVMNAPHVDVWIGLNDFYTEGLWQWEGSSRDISFNNFISGQPDGGTSQNCAVISWGWDMTTKWDDNYCDKSFPFICERY